MIDSSQSQKGWSIYRPKISKASPCINDDYRRLSLTAKALDHQHLMNL